MNSESNKRWPTLIPSILALTFATLVTMFVVFHLTPLYFRFILLFATH